MNIKASTIFWTFIWSWFMGVTAISIGFGAIFPSMNRIAKPFVCAQGKMDLTEQIYNPYPGSTITQLHWYCVDETSGTKTELGVFPMSLYAGTIYGWLLFGFVFLGIAIQANRRTLRENIYRANLETHLPISTEALWQEEDLANPHSKFNVMEGALARMKELKEMRAADLISETEYQEKRAEILKGL